MEHTCLASGDPPRIDNQGNAVPLCSASNDPLIREATMYNFQTCGETSKASLSVDDTTAICSIYPLATDPGTGDLVGGSSGGCCNVGGQPVPVVLAAIAADGWHWRRAVSPSSPPLAERTLTFDRTRTRRKPFASLGAYADHGRPPTDSGVLLFALRLVERPPSKTSTRTSSPS